MPHEVEITDVAGLDEEEDEEGRNKWSMDKEHLEENSHQQLLPPLQDL